MGQVYSHAEVTLVAASGSNASCGLPGLGRVNRPVRGRYETSGVAFCEGSQHVSHLVKRTIWATRGWTFQESLLSRRRIIFTKDEVTFLCNCMHCAESWKLPWALTELLPKSRFEGILPIWGKLSSGSQRRGLMLDKCLEQYATRKLTYPSDALDACTGVLKRLETDQETFVCGVLTERHLLASGNPLPVSSPFRQEIPFAMWISWYHEERHATRRKALPSWSFLGWDGPFKMDISGAWAKKTFFYPHTDENTALDDTINSRSHIPSLAIGSVKSNDSPILLASLRITGWICEFHFEKGIERPWDNIHNVVRGNPDRFQSLLADMDLEVTASDGDEYFGLMLATDIHNASQESFKILIMKRYGDVLERIGIIQHLSSYYSTEDERSTKPRMITYFQDARRMTITLV